MKKPLSFFLVLLTAVSGVAQVSASKDVSEFYFNKAKVCGGYDSIFAIKGKWEKNSDNLVFPDKNFPKANYKLLNARLDSIADLLKASIKNLSGMEANFYRSIKGDAYIPGGPVPYTLNAFFLEYYCNTNLNKILLEDETTKWVYVFVNKLNWFFRDVQSWDMNNDGQLRTVYRLPVKKGTWKGMTVYEPDFFAGGASKVVCRTVIIGRNGKVPWRSLTQKQYLTGLKNQYETEVKNFKEGSAYQKDYIQKVKFIDVYLAAVNEDTLNLPAVIDPKSGIWGFKGKFGKEDEGGYRLVLFSGGEKFFDTSLPRYVPQLIQLMWKYSPGEPVSLSFKNQFEENFPLEKLKAMIR